MKSFMAAVTALLAVCPASGHSTDKAIVAAMKLSEVTSYSWLCTVTDDAQTYDIEGKTEQGGYTWQRQPMPKNIARRLGRSAGHELESIFRDRFCYVINTESGWKTLDELPRRHEDWTENQWIYLSAAGGRTPDLPADATRDLFGLPPAIYIPVLKQTGEETRKVYSNAQFALALPHEELAVIISSSVDFKVSGAIASGGLTDLGAQLLLVHDGHEYIKPVTAAGRFKLWLKGGCV
jgi:hypothetical protein